MIYIVNLVLLIFLTIISGFITSYIISLLYSSIKGCYFVPSNKRALEKIFSNLSFKKNQRFIDLGSGDGRVVLYIAKKYKIKALGLEINPLLLLYSKIKAKIFKIKNAEFLRVNLIKDNWPSADIIYLFLIPKLIFKIKKELKKRLDDGSLIISHGFSIDNFNKYLINKINNQPFPTYFYKKN